MQDSKFWRIAAVAFIAALLNLGHGPQGGTRGELPATVSAAPPSGTAGAATVVRVCARASRVCLPRLLWSPFVRMKA